MSFVSQNTCGTSITAATNIDDGVWHLIDVTYSGQVAGQSNPLAIYKDGALIESGFICPLNVTNTTSATIGSSWMSGSSWLGSVDEVAVYGGVNGALTTAQIDNHYQASSLKKSNPVDTAYSNSVLGNALGNNSGGAIPLHYYRLETGGAFVDEGSLNGMAVDTFGNLTSTSGATVPTSGIDGKGVIFSASSQSIKFSPVGMSPTGAKTVELWVNTLNTTNKPLFNLGDPNTNNNLTIIDAGGNAGLEFDGQNCTGGGTRFPTNIDDGAWHMIDVTYNGSNLLKIYKDGALIGSLGICALNAPYTRPAAIGASWMSGATAWTGGMDEVAVYDIALPGAQIANHYVASGQLFGSLAASGAYYSAVHADNPINYYRFGEVGYTFKDYGSGGNLATSVYDKVTYGATGMDTSTTSGLVFTAANPDRVSYDASNLSATQARTVELWVNKSSTAATQIFKFGSRGNCGNGDFVLFDQGGASGLRFYDQNCTDLYFSTNIDDGIWHLIDVTYNGSNQVQIYKDGVLLGSGATGGTMNTDNTAPANIGGAEYYGAYVGSINELAVYGNVLTSTQITNHYEASSLGSGMTVTLSPGATSALADTSKTFSATAHSSGGANLGTVGFKTLSIAATSG